MESRVSLLVNNIRELFQQIKTLDKELAIAIKENRKGSIQQLLYKQRHLRKKLLSLKDQFHHIVYGDICYITYTYSDNDSKVYKATATLFNLEDSDIREILHLHCILKGFDFKGILEIHRVPTNLI